MTHPHASSTAERIRISGRVQGVGFRETVRQLARRFAVAGWVANVGSGVSIEVGGSREAIDAFVAAIAAEPPPLARIDGIHREPCAPPHPRVGFVIAPSL